MSRKVNITILLYIVWFAVYGLFGKQESSTWTLMYYVVESCFFILLLQFLKSIQHTIKRVINIAIGFQVLRIVYNLVFFIDEEMGYFINDNRLYMSLICAIIIGCLIKETKQR